MDNEKQHRSLFSRLLRVRFGWLSVTMAIPLVYFLWEYFASGLIIAWVRVGSISLVVAISLLLHELGHAIVFSQLVPGGKFEILLTPILGAVKCNYKDIMLPKYRLMLFAAGPLVNLSLALIFFFLNEVFVPFPHIVLGVMVKIFLDQWVMVNLILGCNVLPLFATDGGHILGEILLLRGQSPKRAFGFVKLTFYVVGILLVPFFIYHRDFIGMAFLAAIFLISRVVDEQDYFQKLERNSLIAGGGAEELNER